MSSHKRMLNVANAAKQDIKNILSYTLEEWGRNQSIKYKNKIDQALDKMIKNPNIGRPYNTLMVYAVEKHKIYYRVTDTTIHVLRVLHARMDVIRHLDH